MKLAVTNLFDGVDIYTLSDQRRLSSVPVDIKENVSAPVLFLNNNSIIFGGGSGLVYVAGGEPPAVTQTLHSGKSAAPLRYFILMCYLTDGDIVQALVFFFQPSPAPLHLNPFYLYPGVLPVSLGKAAYRSWKL